MKTTLLVSGAMGLAAVAAVPSVGLADHWRPVHVPAPVRWDRDVDVDVSMGDVPHCVLETAMHEKRGMRIESIQYVRRDGRTFYRFQIDGPRGRDFNIRVAPDGGLLGIEPDASDHWRHEGRWGWRR